MKYIIHIVHHVRSPDHRKAVSCKMIHKYIVNRQMCKTSGAPLQHMDSFEYQYPHTSSVEPQSTLSLYWSMSPPTLQTLHVSKKKTSQRLSPKELMWHLVLLDHRTYQCQTRIVWDCRSITIVPSYGLLVSRISLFHSHHTKTNMESCALENGDAADLPLCSVFISQY